MRILDLTTIPKFTLLLDILLKDMEEGVIKDGTIVLLLLKIMGIRGMAMDMVDLLAGRDLTLLGSPRRDFARGHDDPSNTIT